MRRLENARFAPFSVIIIIVNLLTLRLEVALYGSGPVRWGEAGGGGGLGGWVEVTSAVFGVVPAPPHPF